MSKKRLVIGFLLLAYLVDLLFTSVEFEQVKHNYFCWTGHCFIDYPIWKATYYYHYFAHISIMCVLFAARIGTNMRLFTGLIWLEILDVVDYAITFNTPYKTLHLWSDLDYGIDFNLFKTLVAALLIAKEYFHGVGNRNF
jgi:hypothetical protein